MQRSSLSKLLGEGWRACVHDEAGNPVYLDDPEAMQRRKEEVRQQIERGERGESGTGEYPDRMILSDGKVVYGKLISRFDKSEAV